MNKLIGFFRESYREVMFRVTWPGYGDLQKSSVLVLVASIIFALMIGGIDLVFRNVMEFVYPN